MSKISETVKSEVTVDLKSGLRINMDIEVTLFFSMSKIMSTSMRLLESATSGTEDMTVNLFELTYHDQIFVMKEIARMVRAYENKLDCVAFGSQVFKTQKSLRY